jgi:hypothetical protein
VLSFPDAGNGMAAAQCQDLEEQAFKRQSALMQMLAKLLAVTDGAPLCITALRTTLLAYRVLTAAAKLYVDRKGNFQHAHSVNAGQE